MFRTVLLASAAALFTASCATSPGFGPSAAVTPIQAQDSYYVSAHAAVAQRAAERGVGRAKNVILFIGDGMGIATITAARIYAGQKKGVDGESYRLAMEQLPYSAFSKTYTHDSQVADSAPTAAAMTTGVKSYNGSLGITQSATLLECASAKTNATNSLWEIAEDAGLATGVISTARFTHATPAAAYAKTTERDWEADSNVSPAGKAAGCTDIASQFLAWSHGDGMDVVLAGGRSQFLPSTTADPEYATQKGGRGDGRNLIDEWKAKGAGRVAVTDKAGFDAFNWNGPGQILGLFEPSHMQYEADRAKDEKGEPSIADMTRAAITRLSHNPKGYVLMVEGGRVDHALHAGNAARALADTVALDEAVAAAVAMTDPKDTLIIVTADHSHTLTIQGYPERGNPILGLAGAEGRAFRGRDGKPYTTLGFANGPGSICKEQADKKWLCERQDLTDVDTTALDFLQPAVTPLGSETHAGEDVAIYAGGPAANLFSGTVEQNEIFHVMAKALRLTK
jgi:alkaline phosphatase